MEKIILSGFGDFSEDARGLRDLKGAAKRQHVIARPTYYDWELEGDADAIEKITVELYAMRREEWSENALNETPA